MIKLTDKDKNLVIPSGLGNMGQSAGSGGGVTPEEAAEIASAVTEEAISEYDIELQVDLEEIRDAVSGNSEDIATLSGVTEAIEGNLETVSGKAGEVYDTIFYEEEGETHSQIDDLWSALEDKQDVLEAGSGISIDNPNISVNIGAGLQFDSKGTGKVIAKLGDGMRFGSGDTISLNIGEGLGFSGDTLVVSGGTGGGPTNYYLNDMSQQELADLYDMLAELTEYDNDSSNIPEIFENYRFFAHTTDFDGQQCVQLFFSNWEEQDGDYQLWIGGMLPTKASYPVNIHRTIAIILSDGTLQMNDSNLANIDDFQIRINSNGYIASDMLDRFSSLTKFNRFVFVYQDENIQNNYCAAPLKYFYRKNETVNDEEKLMEYIGVEININGTWYKGDWHFAEYGWSEWNAPDTWTTI